MSATDLLYLLCSLLLFVSAVFIIARDTRLLLHRCYALTALSLLGWVATLPLYYRATDPGIVLGLGRTNFAAAALAVYFGYRFVLAVANQGTVASVKSVPQQTSLLNKLQDGEALVLALLTLFTPLIAEAEIVGAGQGGRHVTVYGPLFLLYTLHVLGYLGACAIAAFRARAGERRGAVRDRLTLVGAGVLATGVVGVVADILLPYGFEDFRFTDAGPLSSALFLLAVGYAVARHRLFDLRILMRKTLVYGLLLSFVLAAYSAVLVLVTDHLAGNGSEGTLTRFGVMVIASSFDPLRRFLEKQIDTLLFRTEQQQRPASQR